MSDLNETTQMQFALDGETFDTDDVVTVTHGYGRVSSSEKHWVDGVLFTGGIARHVPFETARKWKKVPVMGAAMRVLRDDATEAEIAAKCGIQPMSTPKFAALLSAANLDEIAAELGPVRTQELIERLSNTTAGKVVRGTDGKFHRAKPNA